MGKALLTYPFLAILYPYLAVVSGDDRSVREAKVTKNRLCAADSRTTVSPRQCRI